jgi:acetylornithine deacetylase/succinyl-diaminopimelate desuccinylase-like protein
MILPEFLQQLIRIPSVNPDNDPGSPAAGEGALAGFLADWLTDLGAAVTLEEIRPGRPNLIARFAPCDGRPRVLFGPHLDTVGVAGMTIDPFAADLRDGRIFGRGACDTKGPMAAMLWALKEHAACLANSPVAVDFVAFMGEESGQWGSKHFAQHHRHPYRFAIVGEPTGGTIVYATKGSLWVTLRATGRAAHSSQPERGDNAITKLIGALDRLEQDLTESLAAFRHPRLGPATHNLGTIRGGTRPNIVPDLAEAELDIRTTPALEAAGGGLALLERLLAARSLPLAIINPHESPPVEIPTGHPDIQHLLAACPGTLLAVAPWFSDAAHLARAGLPAVCLGPGSIDQAHTADESIGVAELEAGCRQFSACLAGWLRP